MSSEAPHFNGLAQPVRVTDSISFVGVDDRALRAEVVALVRTPIQSNNIHEDLRWRLMRRWPAIRITHDAVERCFYVGFAEGA